MFEMIGVFGGTFDPIHYGHLRPVLDIVEEFNIEKCHFVPCSVPHHRSLPIANSEQRLTMIASAIKYESRFYLDPREIHRDGVSYSIDTVESIKAEINKEQTVCLIIGIDAFLKFDQWHRWNEISTLCHIIVTHRPGWDIEAIIKSNQLSTELRQFITNSRIMKKTELLGNEFGKLIFQPVTQLDISATKIRYLLAEKKSIQYLLPNEVITVIRDKNIYVMR